MMMWRVDQTKAEAVGVGLGDLVHQKFILHNYTSPFIFYASHIMAYTMACTKQQLYLTAKRNFQLQITHKG